MKLKPSTILIYCIILLNIGVELRILKRRYRFRRSFSKTKYLHGCYDTPEKAQNNPWNPRRSYFVGILDKQSWLAFGDFKYKIIRKETRKTIIISGEERLIIRPFQIAPGDYICKVSFTHNRYRVKTRLKLYLTISHIPPVALINGGNSRQAPSSTSIQIYGENAVKTDNSLNFKWTCNQEQNDNSFCKNGKILSTQNYLEIPKNLMVVGETFKVNFKIISQAGESEATQLVQVLDNVVLLQINCILNCAPVVERPNLKKDTLVVVECVQLCQKMREVQYEWTITNKNDANFVYNYKKDAPLGRHKERFFMTQNTLTVGNYTLTVKIKAANNVKSEASIFLDFLPLPSVGRCYTIPLEGKRDYTVFNFYCEQTDPNDSYFYEVYKGDAETGAVIINGKSPDVFNYDFYLARGYYQVKISIVQSSLSIIKTLQCHVVNKLKDKPMKVISSSIKHMLGTSYDQKDLQQLLDSSVTNERKMGIQLLETVLIDLVQIDIKDDKIDDLFEKLKYLAVDDLSRIQPSTLTDFISLTSRIVKFLLHSQYNFPIELTRIKAATCRRMGEKLIDVVEAERYLATFFDQSLKIAEILSTCIQSDSKPLKGVISDVQNQEFQHDLLVEEDPDIVDLDIDNFESIRKLQDATYDVVYTAFLIAQLISMTLAPGEKTVYKKIGNADLLVLADQGKNLINVPITIANGTIVIQEFENSDHTFEILLCAYQKNIFWWNTRFYRIATQLTQIRFIDLTLKRNVTSFDYPVNITLKVRPDMIPAKIQKERFHYRIIKTLLDERNEEYLNRVMKVKRINLLSHQTLRIQFYNLSNEVYDVVITLNRYPDMKDFVRDKIIVSKNASSIMFDMKSKQPSWAFVAILPNCENNTDVFFKKNVSVSYQISGCIYWQMGTYSWDSACEGISISRRLDIIECACKSFSIVAGFLQDIDAYTQIPFDHNFALTFISSSTIFITLITTYILYCIFILFAACKKKESFYFLADNMKHHRYAYLLVIKTGSNYNSGTTSIVVVRIYGRKSASEPHVLNYPDPEMRLLQRFGEDTFVLTTETHLGDIYEIEIWYTCIGSSPSWLCRDIIVYDMQLRRQWYFDINKRFFVVTGTTHIKAQPTTTKHKSKERFWSKIQFCSEYHTWFLFSSQEKFAYMKRLTVVMSTILVTYLLCLGMLGFPKLELHDAFDSYWTYSFNFICLKYGMLSSLVSFSIHISIAWIFRNSRIQFSKHREQGATFPIHVTILCWTLIILNIITCTILLVIYGFAVPSAKSYIWLYSSLIGIASEILIYDNIVVMVHSYFSKAKLIVSIEQNFDIILNTIESQRSILYKRFGNVLFRNHLQHLYTPLKHDEIIRRKIIVKHRLWIASQLKDMLMFSIYFVMLYFLIASTRNPTILRTKLTSEAIMKGEYTRTMSFTDVNSIEDFYTFVEATLIPSMQPTYWYSNFSVGSEGMMIDMSNKFLGIARMRQQRLLPDLCTVPKNLRFLFNSCSPEFTAAQEETKRFTYHWQKYSPNSFVNNDRYGSIWSHLHSRLTSTWSVAGEFATYPGGGYIAFLGRRANESYAKLRTYKKQGWIDGNTRVILIEYLTYSANSNLFNAVRLFYERSVTGFSKATITSQAAKMLGGEKSNEQERLTFIISCSYYIVVLVLAVKHFIRLIKNWRTFFRDSWFVLDLLLTILNVVTVILFVIRSQFLSRLSMDLEREHHNRFIYYFVGFYLEEGITITTSLILTIATLRLWRFFRFGLIFRLMERTLAIACLPLLSATLAFFILLTGFGQFGIVMLGKEFEEFSTMITVSRTLITMCLKPDQFDIRDFLIRDVIYPYFSVYLMIMQVVLLVNIIIVIMSYMKAQMEFSVQHEPYTLKHYIKEQLKLMPKLCKSHFFRIRGGVEANRMVHPKADEFRYANCVSTQVGNFDRMKLLTTVILKRNRRKEKELSKITKSESVLMLQICQNFAFRKMEFDVKAYFYKGHFAGKSLSLIDENRITQMEAIVNVLLVEPAKDAEDEIGGSVKDDRVVEVQKCQNLAVRSGIILKKCDLRLMLLMNKLNEYKL